jgi:hypothetical protein
VRRFPCAGPGAFDFTQGDTNGTMFWRLVRDFLSDPSAEQIACHAPKPILLNTGARLECTMPCMCTGPLSAPGCDSYSRQQADSSEHTVIWEHVCRAAVNVRSFSTH